MATPVKNPTIEPSEKPIASSRSEYAALSSSSAPSFSYASRMLCDGGKNGIGSN
jgi:hypothetical protein